MRSEYTIYSKVDCSACDTAEQVLKSCGEEYTKLLLNVHYSLTEMFTVAPVSHKSFPMVAKDGVYLGGLKELKTELGVE